MTAVQLMLSNDMWEDAISLVDQIKHEVRCTLKTKCHTFIHFFYNNDQDNHCALFHCLVSHLAKVSIDVRNKPCMTRLSYYVLNMLQLIAYFAGRSFKPVY